MNASLLLNGQIALKNERKASHNLRKQAWMMESVWQWLLCDNFKLGSKHTGLHMLVEGLT